MKKIRAALFLTIFSLLNLLFIPLLSIYGLRVCPVLSIPGFGFGCYYTGLYVGLILVLNTGMFLAFAFADRTGGITAWLGERIILTMAGIYVVATMWHRCKFIWITSAKIWTLSFDPKRMRLGDFGARFWEI